MRRLLAITIIAVSLAPAVYGDSVFDVRGAGKDVIPVAGVSRAMGGAVAASLDPLDCAVMSPFASAMAERLTITAGLAHINTRTDNLGEENRSLTTLFPTVSAIIPFKKVSFMTGLYLEKEGRLSLALTDTAYGGPYDLDFRREASIHTVPIFVSSRLHRRLVVSAGILFSAFDTRETYKLDFAAGDRADAIDASDISASGRAASCFFSRSDS